MSTGLQNVRRTKQISQYLSVNSQNKQLQSIYNYQNINKKSEIKKGLTVK